MNTHLPTPSLFEIKNKLSPWLTLHWILCNRIMISLVAKASLRAKSNQNWGTLLSTNPRGRTTESTHLFAAGVSASAKKTQNMSSVSGAHCPILPTLRPPWQNSGSCLPWFRCHANSPDPDMFDVSTIYISIHRQKYRKGVHYLHYIYQFRGFLKIRMS